MPTIFAMQSGCFKCPPTPRPATLAPDRDCSAVRDVGTPLLNVEAIVQTITPSAQTFCTMSRYIATARDVWRWISCK